MLWLQRHVGNVATRTWLSQIGSVAQHRGTVAQHRGTVAQRQAVGGGIAAPAKAMAAVAAANADAADTSRRVTAVLQDMLRSANPTVRNTAQLYTVSSPRLTWTPMTRRSDSAAIAHQLGTVGVMEYFFTGLTQPAWTPGNPPPANTKEFEPGVGGTIQGNIALIRSRLPSGEAYSDRTLASVLVHETSHVLVRSYGEHPRVADPRSFDRYKSEFRSYFIDPFDENFSGLKPDNKPARIREKLVGKGRTDPNPATNPYRPLQEAYWGKPPAHVRDLTFVGQVDTHIRPDGFNLTSSPRLDALFTVLTAAAADPSKVDDVVLAITRLPSAERAEAATSTLIQTRSQALGGAAFQRIHLALNAPTSVEYTGALNPDNSGRITGFYDALVLDSPDGIKAAYGLLNPTERGRLSMNAATLVFINRHVSMRNGACVVGMVNSGSVGQFDAVNRFIDACLDTLSDAARYVVLTAPPAPLLAAARGMAYETRLGFYRLSKDACTEYVEALPPPVSRPMIAILRGEREP
ncbi:MAG: hypothetical protein ACRDS0_29360 [Pseudonocardiaceae bacterium]